MSSPLSFVDYDEQVENLLRTVTGTLLEVYAEIISNIEAADISPAEKITLLRAAADGLNQRLNWYAPRPEGRPAKDYDPRQQVLKTPYARLSRKEITDGGRPIDKFLKQLGGKS